MTFVHCRTFLVTTGRASFIFGREETQAETFQARERAEQLG